MAKHALDPVIVSAVRTPVGKVRGMLARLRPDDMLAHVFKEAVVRSNIDKNEVEEAFAGCANQAGEDNRNVARMAVLLAGLGNSIPAVTLNRLCASGLDAVIQAARGIRCGDFGVALAGGVESMSRAPWVMQKPDQAFSLGPPKVFDSSLGWRFKNSKLDAIFPLESMGETAENLASKFEISREHQDQFALMSHKKAIKAQMCGRFDAEIAPITIPQRKGCPIRCAKDEGPRAETTLEKLASLKPIFREGGSVSAGNSSSLNDGAAALVLTSREFAKAHELPIRACITSVAAAGVDPRFMGIGPVPATKKALKKIKAETSDLDVIELNEAFAVQALSVIRELSLDEDKINLYGGAIALGHPLGCSGARILTTLISVLEEKNKSLGLATLCVGVGQGLSVIIERE